MKVAILGASGFVGSALQKHFEAVVILHRDESTQQYLEKLQNVDVVINLAGAPILKRWSKRYKQLLYSSRVESTQKLVDAVNASEVQQFISTSAVGIYPNNIACDENSELGNDFLATLCKAWEAQAQKCIKPTAILRFGVVLDEHGGALQKMLLPFKLGLGGPIGNGAMMTSWIDLQDLLSIYDFVITHKKEGVFNAVSPNPVSNAVFTKTLAKALHRPAFLPLPTFVLKSLYGEGASVLTDSKEVYPKALLDAGCCFAFEHLDEALSSIK